MIVAGNCRWLKAGWVGFGTLGAATVSPQLLMQVERHGPRMLHSLGRGHKVIQCWEG